MLKTSNNDFTPDIEFSYDLKRTNWSEDAFVEYLKKFLPQFSTHLSENFDEDEVAELKQGGSELVKLVMADLKNFTIYTSSSQQVSAPIFCYKKKQKDEHFTLLYFKQAIEQRKEPFKLIRDFISGDVFATDDQPFDYLF